MADTNYQAMFCTRVPTQPTIVTVWIEGPSRNYLVTLNLSSGVVYGAYHGASATRVTQGAVYRDLAACAKTAAHPMVAL